MINSPIHSRGLRAAFIGWGNVARRLATMLGAREGRMFEIAGILRRSGAVVSPRDSVTPAFGPPLPVPEFLDRCKAHVLVELSTLNPESGEPAISHIRWAIERGVHVVTANKGPIAYGWRYLADLASAAGVRILCESAVMDGAPVFNLFRRNLPDVKVLGFTGVLNSTSNLVIEAMEHGGAFEDGVRQAQALGVAEANFRFDTDGHDSAAKTAALANVLMDARTTPAFVEREGIGALDPELMRKVAASGRTVRLVSRAARVPDGVRLSVRPDILDRGDLLAATRGTSNLIVFHTDLMGSFGAVSIHPGVEQTAYGVYADLVELAAAIAR